MIHVEMYTSDFCPYCVLAKKLLERKGVVVREHNVDKEPELMAESVKRSHGRKTVPQIFIENFHVGGYDDLNAMDQKGDLDRLLKINS